MKILISFLLILILIALLTKKPKPEPEFQTHATWYEAGHTTANGEAYNPDAFTCASRDFPFNTILAVTYKQKTIYTRVNDRGPAKRIYRRGVKLDLSRASFQALAPLSEGKILVTIKPIKHD